jgi:hypothetical protein
MVTDTAASFASSIFKVTLQKRHVHITQQEQQLICDAHVNKTFFLKIYCKESMCSMFKDT